VRLDKWKESGGKLPLLKFRESGWFLVRAVADEPSTYRYATTAPYYVEIGYEPRISRASAKFFVDWCAQRIAQITAVRIGATSGKAGQVEFADEHKREQALGYWRRAEEYWVALLNRANAP
jgi:hypothetical protein